MPERNLGNQRNRRLLISLPHLVGYRLKKVGDRKKKPFLFPGHTGEERTLLVFQALQVREEPFFVRRP